MINEQEEKLLIWYFFKCYFSTAYNKINLKSVHTPKNAHL